MARRFSGLAFLLLGCAVPTGPAPSATLVDGWWLVSLPGGEGPSCTALPYLVPSRDSAAEAIRDCREVTP